MFAAQGVLTIHAKGFPKDKESKLRDGKNIF